MMPQRTDMRIMRIASAENASIELSLAKECVEENGYCWWGTGDKATMESEIIVRTIGVSEQFYGIMRVIELVAAANIPQSDFISNRPKNTPYFPEKKTWSQYYKVTSVKSEIIPRKILLYAKTMEELSPYQLYANTRVILTNTD